MAINKVVNSKSAKTKKALRNVIIYVLNDDKVRDGYVDITGPYPEEKITQDGVYNAFLDEKRLQDKESGRMYAHNVISFHKDENVTPEQVLSIGREFVDHFFKNYQNLITVHQDRQHLHLHIVSNTVSFLDGHKLHQSKKDLQTQKDYTNKLCKEHGLTVAEKGKHFDGTDFGEGETIVWSKDKYNLLKNGEKKSFVLDCGRSVLESKDKSSSRDEFIDLMAERGWQTIWTEQKKHITFINEDGHKVRDSTLNKTFYLNLSKEVLLNEFKRQYELRIREERKRKAERQRDKRNRAYYEAESRTGHGERAAQELNNQFERADSDDDLIR